MFIPLLMQVLKLSNYECNLDLYNINHFFYFLRNDLLNAVDYSVSNDEITMIMDNGFPHTYSKYQNVIRKQVFSLGHEIYVRDIRKFEVEEVISGFKIYIETVKGETFEKRFTFYNK